MAVIAHTHALRPAKMDVKALAKTDVRALAKMVVKTPARPDAKTLLSVALHRAEAVAVVAAIAEEIAAIAAAAVAAIAADTVADVRDARQNAHRRAQALARVIAMEPAVRHALRRVLVHAEAPVKVLAHRYAHADARLVVPTIRDNHLWTLQRKKPPFGMRA